MEYVHHCVFCGWSRPASSATLLSPRCDECGCPLRADSAAQYKGPADAGATSSDRIPTTRSNDVTAMFAGLASIPMLLPVVGVDLGDFIFTIPLALLVFAAVRCGAAARREPRRRRLWSTFSLALGVAAGASAIAVVTSIVGVSSHAAFYLGAAASVLMLVGGMVLAHAALVEARMERVVDALLLSLLVVGLGAYFVAVPGFDRGGPVLTAVFLIDLLAVIAMTLAAMARGDARHRRIAWWLLGTAAAASAGDALVALGIDGDWGQVGTALLWAVAGYSVAMAADGDEARDDDRDGSEWSSGGRWLVARVVLPLTAVLSFAAVAIVLWAAGGLSAWGAAYFGAFFTVALVLAFGRQAWLLLDNRRAVTRERGLRADAMRRNEELEALTGLATTMTQTLEEAPIIEQALGVLHLAARASSSALHVWEGERLSLQATAGCWNEEHAWAGNLNHMAADRTLEQRGRRQVVRLALAARGHRIGVVTLLRGAGDPFDDGQLDLLGLLVDELAVALQNARDYREKLEQAIRDPLTGLYNRRFFFEALEKEVQRVERYGSSASLAFFDVDDFKSINDNHGHAAGDDVLRKIGEIAQGLIRPVDSFARIGGEEFALLMPETAQLDALLVAERLRTAISRHRILSDRRVTVSGGISSCPQDAGTREDLERTADAALYWAKRNGKDLCAVASEVVVGNTESDREGMIAHLYALVGTIDDGHLHTRDHSENVAAYAVALGQAIGLDRERVVALRRAALLHDVGKVAVSKHILSKPGPLTPEEFEEIKLHPTVGATMVLHAGLPEESLWLRHHHERIDGRGYPDGLTGTEIPLEARIIFVADSFEAMTSDRPYRAGMPVADAVAELRRCAGTQFDPQAVEALARLVEAGELTVLALRADAA